METKYYTYELTPGIQFWLVFSLLAMISLTVASFSGYLKPEVGFALYVLLDVIGTALLSGRKS
jgi:hypothetical protein